MTLYNQLLLQGLAAVVLRLTIVSVQRWTCAIIKVECCVFIPDLSGYISATLDDMKGQVKVMSDDNLQRLSVSSKPTPRKAENQEWEVTKRYA